MNAHIERLDYLFAGLTLASLAGLTALFLRGLLWLIPRRGR